MITKLDLTIANAYLLEADRLVLVDTGGPSSEGRLLHALKQRGIRPQDIALILHTHGHGDHVGSSAYLQQTFGIPVALHTADHIMAQEGKNQPFYYSRLRSRLIAPFVSRPFQPFTPDIAIDADFSLRDFGVPARIIPTAGHTPGSVSLVFDSGEAIVGDILMGGHLGGSIQPTAPRYHYFYDSLPQLHTSLQHLLDEGVSRFYVGHGGPLERDAVLHWVLRQSPALVQTALSLSRS
ncbi:MAG: MBL fold metallo-hydrolase [Anaerolineae bacterium]|nr:MBL fold metallo-hydrolase [Anaerolineae bacterium]MBN8619417.1 MBL fold metallo-hydrolase [Anaerolineae bacterium]